MEGFRVGKTEEGRDFLLVAVSDEANISQLERICGITAKLADPRKISDAEAQPSFLGQADLLGLGFDPLAGNRVVTGSSTTVDVEVAWGDLVEYSSTFHQDLDKSSFEQASSTKCLRRP